MKLKFEQNQTSRLNEDLFNALQSNYVDEIEINFPESTFSLIFNIQRNEVRVYQWNGKYDILTHSYYICDIFDKKISYSDFMKELRRYCNEREISQEF